MIKWAFSGSPPALLTRDSYESNTLPNLCVAKSQLLLLRLLRQQLQQSSFLVVITGNVHLFPHVNQPLSRNPVYLSVYYKHIQTHAVHTPPPLRPASRLRLSSPRPNRGRIPKTFVVKIVFSSPLLARRLVGLRRR